MTQLMALVFRWGSIERIPLRAIEKNERTLSPSLKIRPHPIQNPSACETATWRIFAAYQQAR